LSENNVHTSLGRLLHYFFGEICNVLVQFAGYEGKMSKGGVRGQERLISLISQHPKFASFKQGEYFDVHAQLEQDS
jgi:hypothetical protein